MDQPSEDSVPFYEEAANFADNSEPPVSGHFYSVFIPHDVRQKGTQTCDYIYKDKAEAMKMVKKTKKARFKHFEFFHDALKFASVGAAETPNSPPVVNGSVKGLNSQVVNERLSPFKGPKPQDLVKLRKAIETGDVDTFRQAVWENPRYLISSGDTPSILQEGFRYNALHVAAKAKSGILTEVILNTISNPKFVKLLYGDDVNENVESRIQVLLDLYLNTPDKGLNETPLHFAAKFGAVDVVEVLVSFPECDKSLKNKYGQTPDMIICDRCDNIEGASIIKKKIALHLENSYYVPVLRAEDDSVAPVIGEPFSPGRSQVVNKDPLSPRLEIHAFAGPMNKEGAEQFRKVWKTPPRTSTPIKKRIDDPMDSVFSLRYTDPSKGLERLGQKLANKFDVNWKEYWSFLDCFVDIGSDEGLALLENYLTAKIQSMDNSYLSPDSPEEASKKSLSTIADLCLQMQNCNINQSCEEESGFNSFLCVEKACNVFANRIASEIYHRIFDDFSLQVSLLEMQTKQVELLILSYLDDYRFNKINFSQLHPRLGLLTSQKLCYFIEKSARNNYIQNVNKLVTECVKAFDCFSSDDEANYPKDNKPTSSKKQLICLMQNILNNFTQDSEPCLELDEEQACRDAWMKTKECTCIFHFKKSRKTLGLSRNNSARHSRLKTAKKLFFERIDVETSSSDDDFYTPPESPSKIYDSDNEADFSDVPLTLEVFVEGSQPTKTDNALYKALKYSDCCITPGKYPNIYRWFHNVGLYSEAERQSWPRSKIKTPPHTSLATPPRHASSKATFQSPSSSSWLRITGANSPRASLQKLN
ncbi:ankyrin repeat and LEM domain-containing protein 2 [Tribolium castaneum]|uniref:Ankyrin repeat and LEM domain-containing protein 2-like Protein n=1 Tax=Tribolium castaneum TaxID=7070 RepID=D2A2F8_TRICA|nr:PREDICTED: ankyrin repeat and LEM domain-containing protein 2 [Tribolium castaneum]EFA02194.1 Ankyrin repeat and LEM domain-containing protein 2-like Protein [Tribolium castaneum]|eukprot:XP_966987.1 PREDICTED: ankyrin repeat and LEM domain-containing protein 2 [Tribolium castaneum]